MVDFVLLQLSLGSTFHYSFSKSNIHNLVVTLLLTRSASPSVLASGNKGKLYTYPCQYPTTHQICQSFCAGIKQQGQVIYIPLSVPYYSPDLPVLLCWHQATRASNIHTLVSTLLLTRSASPSVLASSNKGKLYTYPCQYPTTHQICQSFCAGIKQQGQVIYITLSLPYCSPDLPVLLCWHQATRESNIHNLVVTLLLTRSASPSVLASGNKGK